MSLRLTIVTILAVLWAVPVRAQDKPDHFMRAGYVSLTAVSFADIETTGRALERGLLERNPILQPFTGTPGAVGLVSGGLSAGVGLGAYQLHRKGKRTQARILIWTWTIVRGAVVIHNVRQLRSK